MSITLIFVNKNPQVTTVVETVDQSGKSSTAQDDCSGTGGSESMDIDDPQISQESIPTLERKKKTTAAPLVEFVSRQEK